MDVPPVQYVRTSDGYNVAYAVSGRGPPILVLSFAFEHVQLAWEYSTLGDWLRGLGARFTVIQVDTRGSGLSTRRLEPDFVFEHFQRDIEAVIERVKLDGFIIWGVGGGGAAIAARYAIDNPGKVSALVFSSPALSIRAPSFLVDIPSQDWDMFLHGLVPRDKAPEEARRQVALLKQAFDQKSFVQRMRASAPATIDMEGLFQRISSPTLVLHARDYVLFDVETSVHVAQLARGSFKLIDGSHVYGNADQGIRAIEDLVSHLLPEQEATDAAGELSARELDVLRLLATGKSNQQIADELVISLNTVRRHVSNILDKTGVANRAQAAIYARDHGIA